MIALSERPDITSRAMEIENSRVVYKATSTT